MNASESADILFLQVDSGAEELLGQLRSALLDRLRTETCAVRLRLQLEFLMDTSDHDTVC